MWFYFLLDEVKDVVLCNELCGKCKKECFLKFNKDIIFCLYKFFY